ncbi:MAG: autoinducer binding domain-containing protein [Pseudomonas sp.]|uniref:autoinducer binding domain-containing protein n=1 Tax=Pseudomonas abieticivorans TaxID=2931382 RepID=UPI0020BD62BF|nr:autoinducer binding domain-containing protein [Pseudomonas sp. PIA16]MDE1168230.1 autoinducer binding domain-containing protein [Pseudomonas sp.]
MEHWKAEQLRDLQCQTDERVITRRAVDLVRQLGFDYLAFGTYSRTIASAPKIIALTNMPKAWTQRYQSMNYVAQDPTVAHCTRSMVPLHWTDEVLARSPCFRDDAHAHGIRHGVSQSAHDHRGSISVLSLVRREAVTTEEFYDKAGQVLWLCNVMHSLLSDQLLQKVDGATPSLSVREIEVLRWSAEGKTAADISMILCLSERTVNFHVHSAIKKLNASNKTSAVVQAAMGGLL